MSFERISNKHKHRSTEPTVTLGRNNRTITFSTYLLKKYNPDKHRRVIVLLDKETRRVGFRFHPEGDLLISKQNQIYCKALFRESFRESGIEGDGIRRVAIPCNWTDDVDCYIEVSHS